MRACLVTVALVASLTVACGDDPVRPPGTVRIVINTIGVDTDASYEVRADDRAMTLPSTTPGAEVEGIRAGTREIVISDVASNCTVAGGTTREITVASGASADVTFDVSCVAVTGVIGVTAVVTGGSTDHDGFTVAVGTSAAQSLAAGATRYITGRPAGAQSVVLGSIAPNCTVTAPNPRNVTVVVGGLTRDTVRTTFNITCVEMPSDVRVTTATTGTVLDPDGYTITVGGAALGAVSINGNATVTTTNGTRSVGLDGVAGNCFVTNGANPRSVAVIPGVVTNVSFAITCTAVTGLEVAAVTTGADLDANGYLVAVAATGVQRSDRVPANGMITFTPLPAATYTVTITDVAANCTLTGGSTRTVTTTTGTIRLDLAVACTAVPPPAEDE